jgi:hypothetical protein
MTPLRDELSINREASVSLEGSERMMKVREKEERRELSAKLQGLPEPQYAYEINIPDVEDEQEGGAEVSSARMPGH